MHLGDFADGLGTIWNRPCGKPQLCLGCKSGKDVVIGASCALPQPSPVPVAGILSPEVALVSSSPVIVNCVGFLGIVTTHHR